MKHRIYLYGVFLYKFSSRIEIAFALDTLNLS
jgi:hypothetical protein